MDWPYFKALCKSFIHLLCVYICVCVLLCMHEGQRLALGIFLSHCAPYIFSLILKLTVWLDWQLKGSPVSASPVLR